MSAKIISGEFDGADWKLFRCCRAIAQSKLALFSMRKREITLNA
jgi:hypothetical protein